MLYQERIKDQTQINGVKQVKALNGANNLNLGGLRELKLKHGEHKELKLKAGEVKGLKHRHGEHREVKLKDGGVKEFNKIRHGALSNQINNGEAKISIIKHGANLKLNKVSKPNNQAGDNNQDGDNKTHKEVKEVKEARVDSSCELLIKRIDSSYISYYLFKYSYSK